MTSVYRTDKIDRALIQDRIGYHRAVELFDDMDEGRDHIVCPTVTGPIRLAQWGLVALSCVAMVAALGTTFMVLDRVSTPTPAITERDVAGLMMFVLFIVSVTIAVFLGEVRHNQQSGIQDRIDQAKIKNLTRSEADAYVAADPEARETILPVLERLSANRDAIRDGQGMLDDDQINDLDRTVSHDEQIVDRWVSYNRRQPTSV